MAKSNNQKQRVQLDFAIKEAEEIDALVDKLDCHTRAQLFRDALTALKWMVRKTEGRWDILARGPDNREVEPEFEFLQHLRSVQGAGKNASAHTQLNRPLQAHESQGSANHPAPSA